MTQMKWHEVIKHMAEHGFESVERQSSMSECQFFPADASINPTTRPDFEWRIRPATLKISVEIPKPVTISTSDPSKVLWIGGGLSLGEPIIYDSKADRDEAQRILVAALRGESS